LLNIAKFNYKYKMLVDCNQVIVPRTGIPVKSRLHSAAQPPELTETVVDFDPLQSFHLPPSAITAAKMTEIIWV
jgi:hypothetical protein